MFSTRVAARLLHTEHARQYFNLLLFSVRQRFLFAGAAKTTGVGGEARSYDGGKKVRGRKCHLLVDTEGSVLKAKVHSSKVPNQDGIELPLDTTRVPHPPFSQL